MGYIRRPEVKGYCRYANLDLRKSFLETQTGWEATKSGDLLLVIGVGGMNMVS